MKFDEVMREIAESRDLFRNQRAPTKKIGDLYLSAKEAECLRKCVNGEKIDHGETYILNALKERGWSTHISGISHKTNKKDFFGNPFYFHILPENLKQLRKDISRAKIISNKESFPEIIKELLFQFQYQLEEQLKRAITSQGRISLQDLIEILKPNEKQQVLDVWFKCPNMTTCPESGVCHFQNLWSLIIYSAIKSYLFPEKMILIWGKPVSLKGFMQPSNNSIDDACGIKVNYKLEREGD